MFRAFLLCIVLSFPSLLLARTYEEILKSKELRVCVVSLHDSVFKVTPKNCKKNCKYSGPNYDVLMSFIDFLGNEIRPKFKAISWSEQFKNNEGKVVWNEAYTPKLFKNKECDIFPNSVSRTYWRENKVDIITLFPEKNVIVVKRNMKDVIRSSKDLGGFVTAVMKDSIQHQYLKKINSTLVDNIKIKFSKDVNNYQELIKGNFNFIIMDASVVFWVIQNQYDNLSISFTYGTFLKQVGRYL